MKNLLIITIFSLSFSLFSAEYRMIISQNEAVNIVVLNTQGQAPSSPYDENGYDENGFDIDGYNQNGFDINGIHRDTGTEYNPSGFDQNGFGQEICLSYNQSQRTVENISYDSGFEIYSFIYNGSQTNRTPDTLSTINGHDNAYQNGGFIYYPSTLMDSYRNTSNLADYSFYLICRQAVIV